MTLICYIVVLANPLSLTVAGQEQSQDGLLLQYRQTMENFGVASDAGGAHQFLQSLLPNAGKKAEIQQLILGLSSPTFIEREAAEKRLIAKGPIALDQLRLASDDGDTETRSRAHRCVEAIEITHGQLVSAAIEILKRDSADQPNATQRLATVFQLLRRFKHIKTELMHAPRHFVDESCREELRNGLADNDTEIRIASLLALPQCFTKSELQEFVSLMADENESLAVVAIETIGYLDPDKATELLINKLSHHNHAIRQSAADILRTISSEYYSFRADSSIKSRREAIEKWKSWYTDNSPITVAHFEKLNPSDASPTGFLVSVSNTRVCQFDLDGKQIWNHKLAGYDAQYVNEDEIIVAERNRDLVRVINRNGETQLRIENVDSPSDVEMLDNGNVLALSGTGKLYEFADGKLLKTFTGMKNPFDADRLPNGDTIVADSGNNRLIIFDPHGRLIWQLPGLPFPNNVHRLNDGKIVFTTYTTGDVVMLSRDGDVLWRRNLPDSTLYSVYATSDEIYVADGGNSKIWVLDPSGQPIREIIIPEQFCDIDFITD